MPKIVTIDIETSPIEARVWSLKEAYIGLNQVVKPSRVICAAWQVNDGPVKFSAEWGPREHRGMVETLHAQLNAADILVHYNGRSFDVPRLNTEFLQAGLAPPAPYTQLDVYRGIRSRFGFASNRLEYLASQLLEHEKIKTDMDLWNRVLAGDKKAQKEMQTYNENDVRITWELYQLVQAWIERHPNIGLYGDDDRPTCTGCGSLNIERRGFSYTSAGKFQRYQCRDCARWVRDAKRISTTQLREANN